MATPSSAFSQNHWWASPSESCKFLIFQHSQMYTENITTGLNSTMERPRAGREGGNRGWHGWMVSPTQWTWVWAKSGKWWWTGRPGVLQSVGSQKVGHNLVTEQQWNAVDFFWGKLARPFVNSWGQWHSCGMFLFMHMTQGWAETSEKRKRRANKMSLLSSHVIPEEGLCGLICLIFWQARLFRQWVYIFYLIRCHLSFGKSCDAPRCEISYSWVSRISPADSSKASSRLQEMLCLQAFRSWTTQPKETAGIVTGASVPFHYAESQAIGSPYVNWAALKNHPDVCWRRLLRVPWTARRSNQSILKEIHPE